MQQVRAVNTELHQSVPMEWTGMALVKMEHPMEYEVSKAGGES